MSSSLALHLPDLAATERLARSVSNLTRPGDAILLAGPLGAGKSAFARAFLRHAAGDASLEVPSPSFTLVQSYDLRPTRSDLGRAHHFDLWRLEGPASLTELGWEEALCDVVIVEWPERLGAHAPDPEQTLCITFAVLPDDSRRAGMSGWPDRLDQLQTDQIT